MLQSQTFMVEYTESQRNCTKVEGMLSALPPGLARLQLTLEGEQLKGVHYQTSCCSYAYAQAGQSVALLGTSFAIGMAWRSIGRQHPVVEELVTYIEKTVSQPAHA